MGSFLDLPLIVQDKIMNFLPFEAKFALACTCTGMRDLLQKKRFRINLISQNHLKLSTEALRFFLGIQKTDTSLALNFERGVLIGSNFFEKLRKMAPNLQKLTIRNGVLFDSEWSLLSFKDIRSLRLVGVSRFSFEDDGRNMAMFLKKLLDARSCITHMEVELLEGPLRACEVAAYLSQVARRNRVKFVDLEGNPCLDLPDVKKTWPARGPGEFAWIKMCVSIKNQRIYNERLVRRVRIERTGDRKTGEVLATCIPLSHEM